MILSVDFIAQLEAEVLPGAPLQSDVAMISIATPGERPPRLPHFLERLSLEFHDVESDQEPWIAFNDEHATAVLEFIARIHTQEKEWRCIIHCKAGISRSAAVALFVESVSQCAFPRKRFAGFANRLVIRTLEAASEKAVPVPRALTRREEFGVRVLRDFEKGLTRVTVESIRNGETAQVEGLIADEAVLICQAVEQVAGFKDPPPVRPSGEKA